MGNIPWYFAYDNYVDYMPHLRSAIENQTPFSIVRIGDGELAVMSQGVTRTIEDIMINVPWASGYGYCGVKLPDLVMRDRMFEALKNATVVGMFAGEWLVEESFKWAGFYPKIIVPAFSNIGLPMNVDFVNLVRKHPPLLVGRNALKYKEFFESQLNIEIPGTVGMEDVRELDQCIAKMLEIPHEWSLVCAGANAVVICAEMAYKYGKVSFDGGHMLDNAMHPDYPEYWLKVD